MKFNGSRARRADAVQLDDLTNTSGEWLRGEGSESDIVISSRVRLARNLADFPFISRATPQDRTRIEKILHDRILGIAPENELLYLDLSLLEKVDRQFLVERHLISRELAEVQGARAVAVDSREKFSLMVNEEDHLRIQAMQSGLNLAGVWEQVNRIDDVIEEKVAYAFHDRLGYLTACPTNVGTGMRVSVMLHLPALVITRQIDKVFRSLQKISLAVRGLYGEGSQAMGDFYQISNQITLGRTESELIRQVSDIVPVIIDYERQAREFLIKESHENLHDRVSRAYGILRTAQTISSEETMHLLSSVRMGVNLGLIKDLSIPAINDLFIRAQPAHLQKMTGSELESTDRNIERARFLRRHLNKENGKEDGGAGSESGSAEHN
jgi:protein arginine kinase